jgi:LysR family glycine cleavage system transcriptional activator
MARRLPPLNALRAFEAAARNLSFLKAGEELAVTPGAISQQVRGLEQQIGVPLFRRLARGVLLTDAGQLYARQIGQLFDGIAAATEEARRDSGATSLRVVTGTSFAARWLIPRLGTFRSANPTITLRVVADDAIETLAAEEADVGIHYGPGKTPGLESVFLFSEDIFPVCSPKLLAGPVPLASLEDLGRHSLLDDEPDGIYDPNLTWRHWLKSVGAGHIEPPPGVRFSYTHMALQAAAAGHGVALGTSVLGADDLIAGTLVRPLEEFTTSKFAYWLVATPAAAEWPKVKAFRDWVMSETRRFLANDPERAG